MFRGSRKRPQNLLYEDSIIHKDKIETVQLISLPCEDGTKYEIRIIDKDDILWSKIFQVTQSYWTTTGRPSYEPFILREFIQFRELLPEVIDHKHGWDHFFSYPIYKGIQDLKLRFEAKNRDVERCVEIFFRENPKGKLDRLIIYYSVFLEENEIRSLLYRLEEKGILEQYRIGSPDYILCKQEKEK